MREIKFRGKRRDNGEWVYGFLYRHDPPLQCFASEEKEQPSFAILKTGFADWNMPRPIDQWEVDGKTVGQFTGLKDKTGTEIYEGDICEGHSDGNGVIKWSEFDGGYDYIFDDEANVGIWEVIKEIKVIGNIYENPLPPS